MSSPSLPPLPDLNDTRAVAQWARTTGTWTDPITADKLAVMLRAYGDSRAAAEHARMNAVLAAQSAAHHLEVQEQVAAEREALRVMLADDAAAMTYQTLGQYRTALLAAIRSRGKP